MSAVSDHSGEIDGLPVFWRDAPPPGDAPGAAMALYLHGVVDRVVDFLSAG